MLLVSGCVACNGSPIHMNLTAEEFSERVRVRFHWGMPGDQVEERLRAAQLGFVEREYRPAGDGVDERAAHWWVFVESSGCRWVWKESLGSFLGSHLTLNQSPDGLLESARYEGVLREEPAEEVVSRSGPRATLDIDLVRVGPEVPR